MKPAEQLLQKLCGNWEKGKKSPQERKKKNNKTESLNK